MPLFHLKFSAPHSILDHVPLFGYMVDTTRSPQNVDQLNYLPVLRYRSPLFASVRSFPRLRLVGAMHINGGMDEKIDIVNLGQSIVGIKSCEQQNSRNEILLFDHDDSTISISNIDSKERERRKKIALANKGKAPWNKGRKHSAETCKRIKHKTIEALRDPKVRMKMSQRPRSHSAETKEKLSSSLRRVWEQRLKWKRSREKILLSWVQSIADAAKKGGIDQQELDWDSYDKIREELYLHQLQQTAEKEKAKQQEKMRAKDAAQRAKEKKKERLAYERMEDNENNKGREELTFVKGMNVKQRLKKLNRRTSTNGQLASRRDIVTSQLHIEKLDVELVKRERMRREVSFADQIRAAKNQKMELATSPTPASSVPVVIKKPMMRKFLHSQ